MKNLPNKKLKPLKLAFSHGGVLKKARRALRNLISDYFSLTPEKFRKHESLNVLRVILKIIVSGASCCPKEEHILEL